MYVARLLTEFSTLQITVYWRQTKRIYLNKKTFEELVLPLVAQITRCTEMEVLTAQLNIFIIK